MMTSNHTDKATAQDDAPPPKVIRLPEPDNENITVLTHQLPNDPILPWNRYDSPWLAEESLAEEGAEATEPVEDAATEPAPLGLDQAPTPEASPVAEIPPVSTPPATAQDDESAQLNESTKIETDLAPEAAIAPTVVSDAEQPTVPPTPESAETVSPEAISTEVSVAASSIPEGSVPDALMTETSAPSTVLPTTMDAEAIAPTSTSTPPESSEASTEQPNEP